MLFTFAFRLLLDLYIKFLKQVAKHLNYFSYVITNTLLESTAGLQLRAVWTLWSINMSAEKYAPYALLKE